jgi:hypothetical protein
MRAGTSKRNWLLFWCPVFRHEAQRRVSAIAPAESREKRAATVDVLVFGWYQAGKQQPLASCTVERHVQALLR